MHYRLLAYSLIKRIIPGKRELLAKRHVKGSGIEIGAMHNPLRVPRGVSVQYVDYLSLEANRQRFSEIKYLRAVKPHLVEDGFILPSFEKSSVDFVIANHVLEHSNNLFKTLDRWAEVLLPGGILFFSVPLAERCFDRGRPITTVEHFVDDFELERAGNLGVFRDRTRQHYVEWLSISTPAIMLEQGKDAGQQNTMVAPKAADDLLAENADIHFHTFSVASFEELLKVFCEKIRPDFRVLEIAENGVEIIGVLKRA